jgi:SNF2 family DNA or RNA helicase
LKYGEIELIEYQPPQTAKQWAAGIMPKKRRVWEVTCAPNISLQLKRMFPVLNAQQGKLRVSDTPEMCRNLSWFMLRYPMKVTPAEQLYDSAAKFKDREERIGKLTRGDSAPSVNAAMIKPLRGYQELAGDVAEMRGSLLLCDHTGVGKTASAIGLMVRAGKLPAVVVTPTHLPKQWKAAIAEFAGDDLLVHIVTKGTPYDLTKWRGVGRGREPVGWKGRMPDIILISYSKLAGWAETLGEYVRTVVFDEVQALRHQDSLKWEGARYLASCCTHRLACSATPFFNYGGEFFNVAEVIAPGEMGTRDEFYANWCSGGGDKIKIDDPVAFHAYLKETGLMLRRTRKDVGRELPPCSKIPFLVECDADVFEEAASAAKMLARRIVSDEAETYRGERMNAGGMFDMIMRQATGLSKAPQVAEFVKMLLESEKNVVLYGWHRNVYKIWLEALKEFNPVMYTGSESPAEKDYSKQKFMSGQSRVMIISLRSGEGIDGLQFVTRTVVIGELDWSPGVIKQDIERVDRDGQADPVMAYYMLSDHEDSCDPFMMNALGIKTQQIEGVVDGTKDFIEELQSDGGHIRKMAEAYLKRGNK